jgi:hypothetical protein
VSVLEVDQRALVREMEWAEAALAAGARVAVLARGEEAWECRDFLEPQ